MFKKFFFHGLISGILASIAAVIYYRIYYFATAADFSQVLGTFRIISLNFLMSLSATFISWIFFLWLKHKGEVVFNFFFSVISFALIVIPISVSLPLNLKSPELFPGLSVPMLFFPALAWFTTDPFFRNKDQV